MTTNSYIKTLLFSAIFLIKLLIFSQPVLSYATNITVEPSSNALYQGQSVSFIVSVTGAQALNGDLFYRPVGIRYYQRIPIIFSENSSKKNSKKNGRAVITLPLSAVVSPGLEYYVQVADISGKIITSPPLGASTYPHTLQVFDLPPLSSLNLVSPDPEVSVLGDKLLIVIEENSPDMRLTNKSVTIMLDDTDITGLADITNDRITFSTPLLPEAGEHTITAIVSEGSSTNKKTWKFIIGTEENKSEKLFYTNGGLSFNYGNRIRNSSGSTGDTVSGNLNLDFGLKKDDWEATWNGINIQYIKDNPNNDVTISSGFNFTLRRSNQLLEYGDITINETPLSAPSFARRGIQVKLKGFDTELHLFDVSTETVSGWKPGIGSSGRQVYGLSLKRSLLKKGGLPFTVVYITGENKAINGFNTTGTLKPSKGDIVGVSLNHTIHGVKLEGEVASSRYDADTSDDANSKSDTAANLKLSTALGLFFTTANYYRYGSNFASIANPNFTADREGISASMNTSFATSTVSLSIDRGRDNVKKDPSKPVVYSTSGTASYGISVVPWPSLNISYSHSVQASSEEPVGTQNVENSNNTVNMSLAKSGETWNVNLIGNYGRLNDKVGVLDNETRGLHLSGNYTPLVRLSLSPSVSFTESESLKVVTRTRIASFTAGIPLIDKYANTNFQVSYTLNDASDGSQDSTNLNGSWRLSMDLHEFIKKWINYGSETLALTASYSYIDDKISSSRSEKDLSVFLSLNLHAPIGWRQRF